jgi:hypothetical protein
VLTEIFVQFRIVKFYLESPVEGLCLQEAQGSLGRCKLL